MGCVYCVTNTVNGKKYIGKTNDLVRRKAGHIRDGLLGKYNSLFHQALRKYGIDKFEWMEIFVSDNDKELLVKEKEIIQDFKDKGIVLYNLTIGGDGVVGYKWTKEQTENRIKTRQENLGTYELTNEEYNIRRKLKAQEYNLEHKTEIQDRHAQYWIDNKEFYTSKLRTWRNNHVEYCREYQRKRRAKKKQERIDSLKSEEETCLQTSKHIIE